MKAGIIDLGTNTFNILIAEVRQNEPFDVLLNTKSAVMLGKEGINDGFISDKAFTRAYGVIRDFSQMIEMFQCDKIVAYGTSAIRSASNSGEFIAKIKRDFNIDIEPISGHKEAEFIYYGVRQAIKMEDGQNYLIIDIGGGSVEFIICNSTNLIWKQSFLLGGARLLQRFNPSDPITDEQIQEVMAFFDTELKELKEALSDHPVSYLLGSSGAYDSFAEVLYHAKESEPMPKSSIQYPITLAEFDELYNLLVPATYIERLKIPGLETLRVETIVMATLLTRFALNVSGAKGIIQSAYSLKEGVAATIN